MATTAEIDAALSLLRSSRVALANTADTRARCVLARDAATAAVTDATQQFLAARDAVTAAKTALQTLLAQPET
jgi:hypothetical protein